MRDQCGAIFKQARLDLETSGLATDLKDNQQPANNEESLASDIDKELENLQVSYSYSNVSELQFIVVLFRRAKLVRKLSKN